MSTKKNAPAKFTYSRINTYERFKNYFSAFSVDDFHALQSYIEKYLAEKEQEVTMVDEIMQSLQEKGLSKSALSLLTKRLNGGLGAVAASKSRKESKTPEKAPAGDDTGNDGE